MGPSPVTAILPQANFNQENKIPETLAIIKPDAVARHLVGEIITRIERKGFVIVRMELVTMGRQQAGGLYEKFGSESFFSDLVGFMTSGPSIVMILDKQDVDAINAMRCFIGACDAAPCVPGAPGTIRGDFGTSFRHNVIHASDSTENARREIRIFFPGYLDP